MKQKEIRRFVVNERALCDSHRKLSRTVPLENWRIWMAGHSWKKRMTFTLKKKNMVQRVYGICDRHKQIQVEQIHK